MDCSDKDLLLLTENEWVKDLREYCHKTVDRGLASWASIVIQLCNEEQRTKFIEKFKDETDETFENLVESMKHMQEKVKKSIEHHLQRASKLCKILQVPLPRFGEDLTKSLFEAMREVKEFIEEQEKELEKHQKELKDLYQSAIKVCAKMSMTPNPINTESLPTKEDVNSYKMYVENLEGEYMKRLEEYNFLHDELSIFISELNYIPKDYEEKQLINRQDNFILSEENMKKMKNFRNSLNEMLKSRKEKIETLWAKIETLWNILEIPLIERQQFQSKSVGYSQENVNSLKEELHRCNELKKANIQSFVERMRLKLNELWLKCRVLDAKEEFEYFDSEIYTEDLLELHEVEVQKWTNYLEENKEIIEMLEEHERLWNNLNELEEKANDKDRYKNRKGNLLQEEKERNKITKKLPVLEAALLNKAREFEISNGTEFLSFGSTIQKYLDDLYEEKDMNKKLKSSARKAKLLTPTKSGLSVYPSSSTLSLRTPQSTTKRKILATPLDSHKKVKIDKTLREVNGRLATPRVVTSKTKRASLDRKRKVESRKIKKIAPADEYDEFEKDLSPNCRSTMHNEDFKPLPVTPKRTPLPQIRVTRATPSSKKMTLTSSNMKLQF